MEDVSKAYKIEVEEHKMKVDDSLDTPCVKDLTVEGLDHRLEILEDNLSSVTNFRDTNDVLYHVDYSESTFTDPNKPSPFSQNDCNYRNYPLPNPRHTPISQSIMAKCLRKDHEFTHLRYTKIYGDPSEFIDRGYTLRVTEMKRTIEIFAVVTMFNEDANMLMGTWDSVLRNISYLCSKQFHYKWNKSSWENVAICVIADGRGHLNPKALGFLGAVGLYQKNIMETSEDSGVSAHLFEITTQVHLSKTTDKYEIKSTRFPLQAMLLLKEKNHKKINSHRWFLGALCRSVHPEICIMLDIGTRPYLNSFYEVWKEFKTNKKVGGVCGELLVNTGKRGSKLVNFLVAAQNFEYNIANILDKPMESLLGYVTVLPGAFSAYRYKAIKSSNEDSGPLSKYFLGDSTVTSYMDHSKSLTRANMYLAEDRVLTFEVICSTEGQWTLKFVKNARADTDVPETVTELLTQRRRWTNGSFFASLYASLNMLRVLESPHGILRKCSITFVIIYNTINLILSWVLPANCYLCFFFMACRVISHININDKNKIAVFNFTRYFYILSVFISLITSLTIRPQVSKFIYVVCMGIFTAMTFIVTVSEITFIVRDFILYVMTQKDPLHWILKSSLATLGNWRTIFRPKIPEIETLACITIGLYFIASLIYGRVKHIFTSFLQYVVLLPSRANVLMIYAYCNLHDTTWGTKGLVDSKVAPVPTPKGPTLPNFYYTPVVSTMDQQRHLRFTSNVYLDYLNGKNLQHSHKTESQSKKIRDYSHLFRAKIIIPWIITNIAFSAFFARNKEVEVLVSKGIPKQTLVYKYIHFLITIVTITYIIRVVCSIFFHIGLIKDTILLRLNRRHNSL